MPKTTNLGVMRLRPSTPDVYEGVVDFPNGAVQVTATPAAQVEGKYQLPRIYHLTDPTGALIGILFLSRRGDGYYGKAIDDTALSAAMNIGKDKLPRMVIMQRFGVDIEPFRVKHKVPRVMLDE
jgi:hypothetical protein